MVDRNAPDYEVFALRYAEQPGRTARENFLLHDAHDAPMPQDYFIWAIHGHGRTIVVDTGFGPTMAAKRKRRLLRAPDAALAKVGVDALTVQDVVITHMHYDHAGNFRLFPQAQFHIQDKEMQYCTGRSMCHGVLRRPFEKEDVVTALEHLFEGRLIYHDGDAELAPGISLHLLGGHTLGQQVVRVKTRRGHLVLASDGAHYWANIRERRPFPLVADVAGMLEGYRRIDELADGPDHVIPGHDPAVLKIFPTVPGECDVAMLHEVPHAAVDLPPAARAA